MPTISTKKHNSAIESGLSALSALTPTALAASSDYAAWPETAALAAELTMCLSSSLRTARKNGIEEGHFNVERLTNNSFLIDASDTALAETAEVLLDAADFTVERAGSVVVAKADKSRKSKSAARNKKPDDKLSAPTKKKLVKTAARDMDVLKDAWSMKVAQRLFTEHVGAGDNFAAFMRFIDDLDNLLKKYRNQYDGEDDEGGRESSNDDDHREEDHDPVEASVKPDKELTEAEAEEIAGVLLAIDKFHNDPLTFRIE